MKKKNTEEAKTDNNNNNNNTHPLEKPLLLPVELYNSNIRMIVKNNMHRAKTILSRVVLRIKQEVEVMVPVQLTNSKGNNNASPSLNVDLYPHTKREYEKIIVEKQFEPSMPVKEGRSATFDLQQLFVDFSKRNDKHDEHFAVNQLRYYSDVLLYVLGEEQQKQNKTSATTLAEIKKEESLKVLPTIKTKYTNSYIVLEMELFFLDEKKNREYMKFISKKNVLSIVTSTDYVLFMEKKNQNGGKVNNEDYEPLAKRVPAEYTTVYINPDK
ncbi:hypothetical protein, conserved [Angomonas deanei]|uniref:Uncharacterized protein n=1 Tax=Angomonas deanei TaxID=59799 RepID=A0A7G2CES1_9TRYP|nr:hypothetical protein, conserved [Angomonas deanei]